MKKTMAVIFFMLCTIISSQCSYADEYADALKRAKTEDKPVVIYFYSNNCGYCIAMDNNVLFDKEISELLRKYLVYIRVDVDKNKKTASLYNIRGYPTTALLEPSGKRIAQIPGYIMKKDFIKIVTYLHGKHYKKMKLGEFLDK